MELDVDPEAALGALERHFDVHLAHSGEDLLPGLLIAAQAQGRILLGEPADRAGHFLLLALDPRRHGKAHHGLGEADLGHVGGDLAVEEKVARLHLLQLGDGADVARPELLGGDVLLALLEEERPHSLLRVCARVDERLVRPDRALEDAEEVDPPREGVGDRLEDERGRVGALDMRDRAHLRR